MQGHDAAPVGGKAEHVRRFADHFRRLAPDPLDKGDIHRRHVPPVVKDQHRFSRLLRGRSKVIGDRVCH